MPIENAGPMVMSQPTKLQSSNSLEQHNSYNMGKRELSKAIKCMVLKSYKSFCLQFIARNQSHCLTWFKSITPPCERRQNLKYTMNGIPTTDLILYPNTLITHITHANCIFSASKETVPVISAFHHSNYHLDACHDQTNSEPHEERKFKKYSRYLLHDNEETLREVDSSSE